MKAYIITGAPGAGKTELIHELSLKGFTTFEEVPRMLLENKTAEKLGFLPFQDLEKFAHLVFKEMLKQYTDALSQGEHLCFFDRGIPDVFAYLENSGIPIPDEYIDNFKRCNFEQKVFICPPWREIYISDSIRPYPFEDTVKLHYQIVKIYSKLGFKLVEIPKKNIYERIDFIISQIM